MRRKINYQINENYVMKKKEINFCKKQKKIEFNS